MGRIKHGYKCRHTILIEKLDAVSRTRALTLQESLALERAIKLETEARAKLDPGLIIGGVSEL